MSNCLEVECKNFVNDNLRYCVKDKSRGLFFVNVEVIFDMMWISINCVFYEVIVSFDVENIGCIDLFE